MCSARNGPSFPPERVVVTGLGAVTPLGADVDGTWAALLAGRSGVSRLTESWADELPVRIAARVDLDFSTMIPVRQLRRMDRSQQLALIAARQAWRDAGAPDVAPDRLGVSIATGVGGMSSMLDAHDRLKEGGWQKLSPYTIPMLMPNGAAAWVGIELGARAGLHTAVSACASSAEAIGYGLQLIRSGRADVVVAGGAEAAILPLGIGGFAVMRALSLRNDEPERASRPFDKGRDGFVMGEGAGMLVLESASHAAKRGADVHAIAAGVGYSADAYHLAQPRPDGVGSALAIQRALADAQVNPEQVVHVNAHATSTQVGDAAEALAIRQAFGPTTGDLIVSATKSMTGHLLGASGAVESIAAIRALCERLAPPTINLENADDAVTETGLRIFGEPCALSGGGRGRLPAVAISNSFGFGGHNVTLAFMTA
jgi:3-oxoacyl-[acyl-carrier-protein] synthase II